MASGEQRETQRPPPLAPCSRDSHPGATDGGACACVRRAAISVCSVMSGEVLVFCLCRWDPEVHDKALVQGALRHGISNWKAVEARTVSLPRFLSWLVVPVPKRVPKWRSIC